MISNEQWEKYLQKYQKLMWTIARRISGDRMLASLEDNYSDLCVNALNSIAGFKAKTGREFDDFIDDNLFSQYTKTVLWNAKNKKGADLTKKMEFRNKNISINYINDSEEFFMDVEDTKFNDSGIHLNSLKEKLDDDTSKVLTAILNNPKVLSAKGKLKPCSLIRPTGLTLSRVQKAVDKLKTILGDIYGE